MVFSRVTGIRLGCSYHVGWLVSGRAFEAFLADLSKVVGHEVVPPGDWCCSSTPEAAVKVSGSASSSAAPQAASVEQLHSATHQARVCIYTYVYVYIYRQIVLRCVCSFYFLKC